MSDPTCRDKECLSFVDNGDGTFSQQVTMTAGGASPTDVPIMQCLEDSSGTTFFATYLVSPEDGALSTTPIYTDATGAAYTPVGAITKPLKAVDSEVKLFCDTGNNDEKFFKLIIFAEDGTITSVTDVDLTGAAYTPTGPIELCLPQEAPACELVDIWICDYTNAVQGTEELEWDASAINYPVSDEETTLVEAGFREIDGCGHLAHENAPDVTRIKTNADTTNIATGAGSQDSDQHELNFYVKLDVGSELYGRMSGASGGIIYAGSCAGKLQRVFNYRNPTSTPTNTSLGFYPAGVYKFRILNHDPTASGVTGLRWDPDADGTVNPLPADKLFVNAPVITQEKAWITKGTDGYTALDGTPLVATATQDITCYDPCAGAQIIGQQDPAAICTLEKIYIIDDSGVNGATEEFWITPEALDPGNTAIETAFTSVDSCGVIEHVNAPSQVFTTSTPGAGTADPGTADFPHQNRVELYVLVPKGGKVIQLAGTGLSARALYAAPCGDKLQPVTSFSNSGSEEVGFYPAGVYHFVMFNHDDGTNGRTRLRWRDADSAAFGDVPVENQYIEPPAITQQVVWVTKGDSVAVDIDGIDFDLRSENIFLCDPCDNQIPVTNPIGNVGSGKSTVVGTEVLSIGGGDPNTATLTVPAAANGAIVQVQLKDKVADASNCIRYYSNGENATATRGFLAGHKEEIYLGCAGSNEATITDPLSELEDFIAHVGETTAGAEFEVTYYAF